MRAVFTEERLTLAALGYLAGVGTVVVLDTALSNEWIWISGLFIGGSINVVFALAFLLRRGLL